MKEIKLEHKEIGKLVKDLLLLIFEIFLVIVIAKVGLFGESAGSILILYYGTSCIISMIRDYNGDENDTNITMTDTFDE
jgi:hypothetical protein